MRKRKWAKAVVSAALATAMVIVPAQAQYLAADGFTIMPNEETEQFWNSYKTTLNGQGIYEHSADNWSFCPEFHDGLLLIQDTVSPTESYATWDNYVDKNGQLHDLNKGRYQSMYSFSEGLASVKSKYSEMYNTMYNVGYVDTKGNEVIPCNDEWCSFQYYSSTYGALWYQGAFKNGKAVILRSPELPSYGYNNGIDYDHPTDTCYYSPDTPDKWYGVEYAYIDTKGNMLTGWKLTQDINTVISLPLYDQDGISLYQRVHGIDQKAPEVSVEPGKEENAPFVPEYHAPELPEYNKDAESLFASTAKVTGFSLSEADIGSMQLEITNPTAMTDAGVIAVALANTSYAHYNGNTSGVFFISYELAPGATQTEHIPLREIINSSMFDSAMYANAYAEQLSKYVAATVFTFENDADLNAFYTTIPFEQHWYPSSLVNDFQPLCDSTAGKQWLQEFAGISRYDADLTYRYYYYPDGSELSAKDADHSLCEK